MAMMDVGKVRVGVGERDVPVRVAMRLGTVPVEIVFMLVVLVMNVAMGVFQCLVGVFVLMMFREV